MINPKEINFNEEKLTSYLEPYTIDNTSLMDRYSRVIYGDSPYSITTTTGDTTTHHYIKPPTILSSTTLSGWDMSDIQREIEKKEISNVNVISERSKINGEYIVYCKDREDLSVEKILKTLSAVKGKLMLDIAPVHIQRIECSITPTIRKNIVTASKKLRMYGKKRPIIARFDDYGNRLPDEIELDTFQGITLKIVDPEDYGDYYLEMKASEFPSGDYVTRQAFYGFDVDDVPF